MRRYLVLCAVAGGLLAAGPEGLPPRPNPSDYAVHRVTRNATIAAALIPPAQVKKMFPARFIKDYAVVEVAIYPQEGATVQVESFDFALKFSGDEQSYPRTPREIGRAWDEGQAPHPGKPDIAGEVGVVYSGANDPVTGQGRGWGAYGGAEVDPNPMPPVPPPNPYAIEASVKASALPEGETAKPVAGYLYFPLSSKKHKATPKALEYLQGGAAIDLAFPAK
jgi:hypothetical protein